MNNGEMIGAIVIALGSILSLGVVVVKPILKVVEVMTELTASVKALTEKFSRFEVNNHDDHKRIWCHCEEQDGILQDHEKRIIIMENRNQ